MEIVFRIGFIGDQNTELIGSLNQRDTYTQTFHFVMPRGEIFDMALKRFLHRASQNYGMTLVFSAQV